MANPRIRRSGLVCSPGLRAARTAGGGEILAVPRGLEPPTFGLGKRCLGPKQYRPLPPRPDLSTFFGTAIPADAAPCHPIPNNWVAIWVATSLPYQGILGP